MVTKIDGILTPKNSTLESQTGRLADGNWRQRHLPLTHGQWVNPPDRLSANPTALAISTVNGIIWSSTYGRYQWPTTRKRNFKTKVSTVAEMTAQCAQLES